MYCQSIFLFVTVAMVASGEFYQTVDESKLLKLIKDLQQNREKNSDQHVRLHDQKHFDHILHHDDLDHSHYTDHDRTSIQNLNLVFKHNNIGPLDTMKPIARTGVMSDKLGARCGCSGNGARCGCIGRDGKTYEIDPKYQNLIKSNKLSDLKAFRDVKGHGIKDFPSADNTLNSNHDDAINGANDDKTLEAIVHNLEKALEKEIAENDQFINNPGDEKLVLECDGDVCEVVNSDSDDGDDNSSDKNGKVDKGIVKFLDDLEKELTKGGSHELDKTDRKLDDDDDDDDDNDEKDVLRCCSNCARKSLYRTVRDRLKDDHTYLRCCKACSRKKLVRADDRKKKDLLNDAQLYHLGGNTDALVIDGSEIENILPLLYNANFNDNDSFQNSARTGNTKLVPKAEVSKIFQKRLLPITQQQKKKLQVRLRKPTRRDVPNMVRYGLPFELNVQGLGQVNP